MNKKEELKKYCEEYGYDLEFLLQKVIPSLMRTMGYTFDDACNWCIEEIIFNEED